MSDILQGLEGVVCLIDDILAYGKTQEEHDKHLTVVYKKLLLQVSHSIQPNMSSPAKKSDSWDSWLIHKASGLTLVKSKPYNR